MIKEPLWEDIFFLEPSRSKCEGKCGGKMVNGKPRYAQFIHPKTGRKICGQEVCEDYEYRRGDY
jgi:hypothetical protein|tara:strand:- start:791 stop:982 length:192 start_codon:yes stop_codon:yes gene_type:complete